MSPTMTALFLPLLFQAPEELTQVPRVVLAQGKEKALPPKVSAKDRIEMVGIGKVQQKEVDGKKVEGIDILVNNVAYEVVFQNKKPSFGRTIKFTGTFDGAILSCLSWERPVDGQGAFVNFSAEGIVILVAPGKDYLQVYNLKIPLPGLPFASEAVQDAAEAGQRVRVTGGLESSAEKFVYRVTRMEVVK